MVTYDIDDPKREGTRLRCCGCGDEIVGTNQQVGQAQVADDAYFAREVEATMTIQHLKAPQCQHRGCACPMVTYDIDDPKHRLRCCGCGDEIVGTDQQVGQAREAEADRRALLRGEEDDDD